jgi:hypothetical protein
LPGTSNISLRSLNFLSHWLTVWLTVWLSEWTKPSQAKRFQPYHRHYYFQNQFNSKQNKTNHINSIDFKKKRILTFTDTIHIQYTYNTHTIHIHKMTYPYIIINNIIKYLYDIMTYRHIDRSFYCAGMRYVIYGMCCVHSTSISLISISREKMDSESAKGALLPAIIMGPRIYWLWHHIYF